MNRFDQPVSSYMTAPVVDVSPDVELSVAEERMREHSVSSLAVCAADGRLLGMISRTDLVRVGRLRAALAGGDRLLTLPRKRVRERMTPTVVIVERDASMREAATRMVSAHVHRLFIVDGGRPTGVLSVADVMRAIVDEGIAAPLSSCMSSPVLTVQASDSVGVALDRLVEAHVHGLVVTEGNWPIGIFTQVEALAAGKLDPAHPVEEVMSCAMLCLPVRTPLRRAAELALETNAQRILGVAAREMRGIATGLDLARIAAGVPR